MKIMSRKMKKKWKLSLEEGRRFLELRCLQEGHDLREIYGEKIIRCICCGKTEKEIK